MNISVIILIIKHFRLSIVWLFVIAITSAIDLSLRPYLLKLVIDKISITESKIITFNIIKYLGFYIFISILSIVIGRAYDFIWLKLNPNIKKYISVKLFNRMLEHSVNSYQNYFVGSLATKINDAADGIPSIIRISIDQLFGNVLALLIAAYTLYNINTQIMVIFILWVFIFIFVSLRLSVTAKSLTNFAANVRSELIGHQVDSLSNSTNIKLFTGTEREVKKLSDIFDKFILAINKRDWFLLKTNAFHTGSFVAYQACCLGWMILAIPTQNITSGDFVLVLTINLSLIQLLWSFSHHIHSLAETIGRVEQGLHFILSPIEIEDKETAKALKVRRGGIILNSVRFHYKGSTLLFEDLSLNIPPQQKIGLVGYSGSGKTTLINLILRLFEIDSGSILIDQQNINSVTQNSLRNAIGVVPQDLNLFHRSIKENIKYAKRSEVDENEIIMAAKKAYADEFIRQLPNGYDTVVGERGIRLSGGQRQRIAIARVFLKNPSILILDEATRELDSVTEILIQKSLLELMYGRTTLVIAHRLSTLLRMDRIVVLKEGGIIEDGTHEQLIKLGGIYKTMWDMQVGGFLPRGYTNDKKGSFLG